jgi:NYN domain
MNTVPATADDLTRRRWMLFVDGENLTIRGQAVAKSRSRTLVEGTHFKRDIFLWFPSLAPAQILRPAANLPTPLHRNPVRSHYYTSVVDDGVRWGEVRQALWELNFQPEVFRKRAQQDKAKGVDIALATDMLNHTFSDNLDVVVLVAGDGDYIPLVREVKRRGKLVYLAFFEREGLNPELKLESDAMVQIDALVDLWK